MVQKKLVAQNAAEDRHWMKFALQNVAEGRQLV